MTRSRLIVVLIAVAVLAAAALSFFRRGPAAIAVDLGTVAARPTLTSTANGSGEIVATRYADIGSNVMGKIVALPVREGDRVRAGQVLARLDAVPAESDAASASEQVAALAADERAAGQAVKAAAADLAAAEARAADAERQYTRAHALFQQGLLPASEQDAAKTATDAASAQVRTARAAVDRTQEAQRAATRRVAQARAQQRRADDTLAKTAIVSPIDGIVSRLRVRAGEMVVVGIQNQPGTTLMTISDLGQIDAEVKVAEADVLRLATGQPATVMVSALPGRSFMGAVVEIGASALPTAGAAAAREFKVVVRLETPDPGLRPGLTCDAEIITNQRRDVLTAPLQSVVLRNDRPGVFVVRDGRAVFTPVTTGVIGGLDMEIGGLAAGTSIVVGPYQVLRTLADGAAVDRLRK